MAVGVFLPMLGIAVFKDYTYLKLSPSGAAILLVLAGLTVLAALVKRFWAMYITGILALALVIYTFVAVENRQASVQSDLKEHVANVPFKSLSENVVSSVKLRIGWPMMLVGAAIVLAVPLVGSRMSKRSKAEAVGSGGEV